MVLSILLAISFEPPFTPAKFCCNLAASVADTPIFFDIKSVSSRTLSDGIFPNSCENALRPSVVLSKYKLSNPVSKARLPNPPPTLPISLLVSAIFPANFPAAAKANPRKPARLKTCFTADSKVSAIP